MRRIYLLLLFCVHLRAGHCASSKDAPSNPSLHTNSEGGRSKAVSSDPEFTKVEIDETQSADSLRDPKFISFFNQDKDDREGLIENVRADVESATFLLNAIRSTSISKEQIKEYRNLFSNGIKVCPLNRGAVRVGETCYEYFSEKLTFPRARHVCKSFGGDLASINLRDNFLYQIRQFYPKLSIDGTQYETWIGATRIPGTRNFLFFDGTVIFSSNARWNSGPREHNCLILDDVNLDQHFIIDDCDCYNKRSFLCQYDVVSIV